MGEETWGLPVLGARALGTCFHSEWAVGLPSAGLHSLTRSPELEGHRTWGQLKRPSQLLGSHGGWVI